jgi:DNA-binding transcriptional ArsR family regulator
MPLGRENVSMNPTNAQSAADTQAGSADFDTWRALQVATDTTRANLIADIVGHPRDSITVEELDYLNPALSDDTIRRHLDILQEAGVVTERALEPGERYRDYPYKFYEITDEARTLFDRNGLFPEEAWTRQYQAVEKTPRIRDVQQMPRPTEGGESEP